MRHDACFDALEKALQPFDLQQRLDDSYFVRLDASNSMLRSRLTGVERFFSTFDRIGKG